MTLFTVPAGRACLMSKGSTKFQRYYAPSSTSECLKHSLRLEDVPVAAVVVSIELGTEQVRDSQPHTHSLASPHPYRRYERFSRHLKRLDIPINSFGSRSKVSDLLELLGGVHHPGVWSGSQGTTANPSASRKNMYLISNMFKRCILLCTPP